MVYDKVTEVGKNYKCYHWDVIVHVCTAYCAYAIECEVKVCNRMCKSQAFTANVAVVSSKWSWVFAMEMIWQHFWKFDEFLVGVAAKISWKRSWLIIWVADSCYNLLLYKWMFWDHSKKLHRITMEDVPKKSIHRIIKSEKPRNVYFQISSWQQQRKERLKLQMNLLWIFLVVYKRCFLGTCRGQYIKKKKKWSPIMTIRVSVASCTFRSLGFNRV